MTLELTGRTGLVFGAPRSAGSPEPGRAATAAFAGALGGGGELRGRSSRPAHPHGSVAARAAPVPPSTERP